MTYQIASKSEKGRKKARNELNGDCCGWIEESGCVVVALADGVGSCKSDSRASKTCCDFFLSKCQAALRNGDVLTEEKLIQFCREIDPVLAVVGDETCFCAVAWPVGDDKATWFHVGDTRIYRYNKASGLDQITVDDHGKAENVESKDKKYGKFVTDHGALIPRVGVCATIGDRKFEFHTGTVDFLPGESLVLCSDGMYLSSTFESDVTSLINESDMTAAILKTDTSDDDDNTLMVLRREMHLDKRISFRFLNEDFEQYLAKMPVHTLIDLISDGLERRLDASHLEVAEVADIVSFMKENQFYPDKKRIDRIFNKALNRLKVMPEGEEKQRFNQTCLDLKDILRFVFTR